MPKENIFELIQVNFGDGETNLARPTNFNDAMTGVTEIQTTCPGCGGLVIKDISKIILEVDTIIDVKCECGFFSVGVKESADITTIKVIRADDLVNQAIEDEDDDNEDDDENDVGHLPAITEKIASSVTVPLNKDGTFTNGSVFIDPIELGLFKTDEI